MDTRFFDPDFFLESLAKVASKIPLTLELTLLAFSLGFVLGLIFALLKINRVPVLFHAANGLISFLRGTPVILQLYLIYYLIPVLIGNFMQALNIPFESSEIPAFALVTIALGLNMSAYLAEAIRSALEAVSKDEIQAAYSMGMTSTMVFQRIVFPEALRVGVPNFSTILIGSLHATSLAFFVTLVEVTGQANINAQENWRYLEAFFGVGVVYWVITLAIEFATHVFERRLNRSQHRNADDDGKAVARQAGAIALEN
ncbi:MAG: amino acid ABC transporter permease [Coriobacteriales bacterium]|jgi:His/Glu/Gln/Arg/opine family amino acid ABC transporter permease subunit|nr:amino acid ABC transporter permease [Coriobacteriales bacterium]